MGDILECFFHHLKMGIFPIVVVMKAKSKGIRTFFFNVMKI